MTTMKMKRTGGIIGTFVAVASLCTVGALACNVDVVAGDDGEGGAPSVTVGNTVAVSTVATTGSTLPQTEAPTVVEEHCPAIADESIVCIGIADGLELSAYGLDTGDRCALSTLQGGTPSGPSMALVGGSLLYCDALGANRAPLTGGAVDHIDTSCIGIISFQGQLLMAFGGGAQGLSHFFTFEQIPRASGGFGITIDAVGLSALKSSQADYPEPVVTTEQIADQFVIYEGQGIETVPFDPSYQAGEVMGLSFLDESTIVLGHPDAIYLVDRATGLVEDEVIAADGTPLGLNCWRTDQP